MADRALFAATFLAALGSGLMAGFFFSFSVLVMQALARLPAAHGITAMQTINVVVINRWFLGVFMSTAAICALLAVATAGTRVPGSWLLVLGCALYLLGTFVGTMAFNVPLNNALAAVDAQSRAGAALWSDYLVRWTTWNHLRTGAAFLATITLTLALCQQYRVAFPP